MIDDAPPSHWLEVTDPAAVRLLHRPDMRQLLALFLNNALSVKAAAQHLQLEKNVALLRVRRLCKAGLLHIVAEQPRAGRAIKLYQAVAPGFFVPYSATEYASYAEWLTAEYQATEPQLAQAFARAVQGWLSEAHQPRLGKRFYRRPDGLLEADYGLGMAQELTLLEPQAPAVLNICIETQLDRHSAKALQLELQALVERYERPNSPESAPYLLRLSLAPAVR